MQSGWAQNKWLAPLTPLFKALSDADQKSYDLEDVILVMRSSLSYDGQLYALPFYGEASFTMYRKDLFDAAGLTMPQAPTWDDIRRFACKLNDPAKGCMASL